MQTRTLGRTGLDVSVLSIGGLYTSSLAGGEAETRRIVRRAIELGINAIDTAPAYADSEATVGRAIAGLDGPLIITTKLGGRPQPFDPRDLGALRASVEESLRLLGRDCIDILMIHEPDRPRQYPWWTNYDPLDGPVVALMDELKKAGKIRFTGLAGTTVTEMTSLVRSDLFDALLTAFNFNVLFREASRELIPAAVERNMGIVAGSVLRQGFLARRFDDDGLQRIVFVSRLVQKTQRRHNARTLPPLHSLVCQSDRRPLHRGRVDAKHVTNWIDSQYKDHSDNTQRNAIRGIQRAFNWAVEERKLKSSHDKCQDAHDG